MGQYYNIITLTKNNNYKIYDRSIRETETSEPEYMLAKLMEHSWIGNATMDSLSNELYNHPTKIAWIGDYADECTEDDLRNDDLTLDKVQELYSIVYRQNAEIDPEYESLIVTKFDYKNKLLVNHDKKEYIVMNEYLKLNDRDDWCIHPLSLLTAIGNGFGGGDYHSVNQEMVGYWAFDTISFEDSDIENQLVDQDFTKLEDEDIEFNED